MKTHFNFKNPKTLSILFAAFALLAIGITGCNKKDNTEVSGTAYIRAVNSAETSAPQDFYVDDSKQNSTALAYTQASAYTTVNAGTHNAQFRTSGTATVNVSGGIYLDPGTYSTFYYSSDNTGVVVNDDNTNPQSGKARVRFINLSSAFNNSVDFGMSAGNKIITNLAYKTASAYNEVDAATSFQLYAAGSSTVTLNIPTAIQAGKIYTIVISGTTTATITYTVYVQN
ncbi:MAG: DUF4397 domain-containing protein [Sphingobacteriaceae bacterium]|nr:MAG: DUF4397 domain-containing protein [Sphingobacteriaceae bacterium]